MSEQLEERLRRDLAGLDAIPLADDRAVRAVTRAAVRRGARRRRGAVIAASIVVVLLGGAGVWAVRNGDGNATTPGQTTVEERPSISVIPSSTGAPTAPAAADPPSSGRPTTPTGRTAPTTAEPPTSTDWPTIAPDPRGAVVDSAVVWAGKEAIVVGGRDADNAPVNGASAYDPATDSWRRLADPPDSTDSVGRINALAAWTGSEVLVLGGDLPDGGLLVSYGHVYDPSADRWTVTSSPPGFVNDRSPWAWTGAELLVWPSDGGNPTMDVTPLAYDPASDSWRTLSEPPVRRRQQAASVWTGTEWVIWGGADDGVELDDGVAYDPATDTWRLIAASPLSARRVGGVWTGAEVIVAAGYQGGDHGNGISALGDAAAYDPQTDTWRPLAGGFAHPGFEPVWTGRQVLMFAKAGVVIYDPPSNTWTDSCCTGDGRGFGSAPIWTGSTALLIGSTDPGIGGYAFTPPSSTSGEELIAMSATAG